jgi:hypothetical protein
MDQKVMPLRRAHSGDQMRRPRVYTEVRFPSRVPPLLHHPRHAVRFPSTCPSFSTPSHIIAFPASLSVHCTYCHHRTA